MSVLNLKVLSVRKERNKEKISICYLCEGTLEKYVHSIPELYKEYDVQRGIITNVYLDRLAKTILEGKFIPPIVLIAEKPNKVSDTELIIDDYKILDGLQRTHRIKSIYISLKFFIDKKEGGEDILSMTKNKLSKNYKEELMKLKTEVSTLWSVVSLVKENKYSIDYLKNVYPSFIQWFEVWNNLDEKEQINKMLVLNAGHKPMDIKHQLELLFLNIIKHDDLKPFKRAKDINSSFFYKNKREGELHLSHFISALLSFGEAKPISVDAKFVQNLQDNMEEKLENIKFYFEEENLNLFIDFTKKLDALFNKAYPENELNNNEGGLKWLGRETILVGLFAGFGRYYSVQRDKCTLKECLDDIIKKINDDINIFKINEFNKAKRTSIDITKVNIGNIFKSTTFFAMCKFLIKDEKKIDWNSLFKSGKKVSDDCE